MLKNIFYRYKKQVKVLGFGFSPLSNLAPDNYQQLLTFKSKTSWMNLLES